MPAVGTRPRSKRARTAVRWRTSKRYYGRLVHTQERPASAWHVALDRGYATFRELLPSRHFGEYALPEPEVPVLMALALGPYPRSGGYLPAGHVRSLASAPDRLCGRGCHGGGAGR